MEPLIYVMAILGCGESDTACRELQLVEAQYRSEAACIAATETELLRHDDQPYPNVVAQCRAAGAAPQMLRGSDVMMPESGRLPAEGPARIADLRTPRRPGTR